MNKRLSVMSFCEKAHIYGSFFWDLPEESGNVRMKKCCGCAYDQGVSAGKARRRGIDWSKIPTRHPLDDNNKDPYAAYVRGYMHGCLDIKRRDVNTLEK